MPESNLKIGFFQYLRDHPLVFWVGLAGSLASIASFAVTYPKQTNGDRTPVHRVETVSSTPNGGGPTPTGPSPEEIEARTHQQVLKHWESLERRAAPLRAAMETYQAEVLAWKNDVVPLETNNDGKYIAANEDAIETYQDSISRAENAASTPGIEKIRLELDDLFFPLTMYKDQPGMLVSPPEFDFRQRRELLEQHAKSLAISRKEILRLVDQGKEAGYDTEGDTLIQAIDNIEFDRLAKEAEERRKEKKEEEERKRRAFLAEAERAYDENKQALAPFTEKSRYRLVKNARYPEMIAQERPASLKNIRDLGLLDDIEQMVKAVAVTPDRNAWSIPARQFGRPSYKDWIRKHGRLPQKAQKLLTKYGDAFVAKGWLDE